MKVIFFFLISLSTFGISQYESKYHTCNELNRFLNDDGSIRIRYQLFFKTTRTHYASRDNCSACFKAVPATLKASDKFCRVGYVCSKRSQEWIDRQNRRSRDGRRGRLDCRRRD